MAINNTLKDIREERNLIQTDLAEAIGSYESDFIFIDMENVIPLLRLQSGWHMPESACKRYFSS